METFHELLNTHKNNLVSELTDFFINHTKIKPSLGNTLLIKQYQWNKLSEDGKRKQSQLFEDYNRFLKLIRVIISEVPEQNRNELEKNEKCIMEFLLQSRQPHKKNVKEVIDEVTKLLNEQLLTIDQVNFNDKNKVIMVPDTNALIINPDMEKWKFDSIKSFQIILLPTVLSELDKLKVSYPKEEVREKAKKIIKRIKDCRHGQQGQRWKLTEGVKISNSITLKAVAVEPKFQNTLNWLDIENNDDRILASFIEVCRINVRNKVYLVTADINLQNKAEFANIPFIEPPKIIN